MTKIALKIISTDKNVFFSPDTFGLIVQNCNFSDLNSLIRLSKWTANYFESPKAWGKLIGHRLGIRCFEANHSVHHYFKLLYYLDKTFSKDKEVAYQLLQTPTPWLTKTQNNTLTIVDLGTLTEHKVKLKNTPTPISCVKYIRSTPPYLAIGRKTGTVEIYPITMSKTPVQLGQPIVFSAAKSQAIRDIKSIVKNKTLTAITVLSDSGLTQYNWPHHQAQSVNGCLWQPKGTYQNTVLQEKCTVLKILSVSRDLRNVKSVALYIPPNIDNKNGISHPQIVLVNPLKDRSQFIKSFRVEDKPIYQIYRKSNLLSVIYKTGQIDTFNLKSAAKIHTATLQSGYLMAYYAILKL